MYYVYIIQSLSNSKYYIGVTKDLTQRLSKHNSGSNRSTKNRGPWKFVFFEKYISKSDAWRREIQIKSYKGGQAFKKLLYQ